MGTRAKLILAVLLTLAFVAVTRETGNLTIQLYRAHYEGRDVAGRESRRQTLDAGYGTTSYNTSTENTETTHDARGWDLGFGGAGGAGEKAAGPRRVETAAGRKMTGLVAAVQDELSRELKGGPAEVLIDRAGLSGAYWTPLVKQGSCAYELTLSREAPGFVSSTSLSGEITFNVEGFCSVRELEIMLAKKIAERAVKTLAAEDQK